MATPVVRYVYRANFCRFLRPLGGSRQLYSTESTPSVVETQHKELEVIDEDGKVKRCDYYHLNVTIPFYDIILATIISYRPKNKHYELDFSPK